jgi:hypothetical protein
MGVLTAAQRKAMPQSEYALPGKHYPINDKPHAAIAETDASKFATPDEKAKIDAAVHAKYPKMGKNSAKSMLNSLTYKLKNGQ